MVALCYLFVAIPVSWCNSTVASKRRKIVIKIIDNQYSYCSIEEATEIIKNHYLVNNHKFYWNGLTDVEKWQYLVRSAAEIERLPVAGTKVCHEQPLQFPRHSSFYFNNDIPSEIKEAQVINAIELFLIDLGILEKTGQVLSSRVAEETMRRWTSGGFKMSGWQVC